MDHFDYRDGELFVEEVPIQRIAADVGTPFYCYSTATLTRHFAVFREALHGLDAAIYYAVKANSNVALIRLLAREGAGADIVSAGELAIVLAAGVAAEKVVFSGVGKTRDEMRRALEAGIGQFNVESEPELEALSEVASSMNATARIGLRLNPDVDAGTHHKITTGKAENKFGIGWPRARELYARAAELPGLETVAAAVHIGSQITSLDPYEAAYKRLRDMVAVLEDDGHSISVLDLGGGLGIPYGKETPPSPAEYGEVVRRVFGDSGKKLGFEPGRVIVGNAGILVARQVYDKRSEDRRFVILDAAMNDLIRPSMYDAHHEFTPVRLTNGPVTPADIVGPICESGDTFARQCDLPELEDGELIAIRSAGAYGAVMSSSYNGRPIVPEILVNGADYSIIRKRQRIEDLIAMDQIPDWLA
jgi:diaminopimelate decarboxylase